MPTRRSVLTAVTAAAVTAPLSACSAATTPESTPTEPGADPMHITYGDDPSQFGELTRPDGPSKGVVVVIHGGFWKAAYGLELGRPLADALAENGWTAWNIEYRRVGMGGGARETCADVHAAIERLGTIRELDTSIVLTMGHSAGGHLAVWAAARQRYAAWAGARVRVTGAISQAGVLDLSAAADDNLGSGAVAHFLGHQPTASDVTYDPLRQVPLDVPVRCIHGRADDTVPTSQSTDYATAAAAAGADANALLIDGDHFVVIDPTSAAMGIQLDLLDELAQRSTGSGR